MQTLIRLQTEAFDSAALTATLESIDSGTCGATVTFTGWVRGDGGLQALTLEHYPGMTEKQLAAIVSEAATRWPLLAVTVVHRIGRLEVGAPIVFVGTASAHRQAAFDACAFVMDWLKTKAPFWKCEEWADGRQSWVAAKDSDAAAAKRWSEGDLPSQQASL
jgi:molybdopterin synthase catalytic subunit